MAMNEKLNREAKYAIALRMREAGKKYSEIAEALGVREQTAWGYVQRALKWNLRDSAEIVRARQLEDINIAKAKLLALEKWTGKDALGFVAILKHEAALFGLDLPNRVIVEHKNPETDTQFQQLLYGLMTLFAEYPELQEKIDDYFRGTFGTPT